jgi:hypothetical protein
MRQSSASPIVCFHQSTRFLRLHREPRRWVGVPWINERRGERQLPPLFLPVTRRATLGNRQRVRACQSHCPSNRKRESRHDVNGCKTLRS